MRIRIIAIALLAIALAACGTAEPGKDWAGSQVAPADATPKASAAGKAAPSNASVPTFAMGQGAKVTKKDDDASGLVVIAKPKVWRKPKSPIGDRPAHGRFVRVEVSAAATTGVFGINPFDFALVDRKGTRYQVGGGKSLAEMADDELSDADLNPGENISGTLTFDVPAGALELTYAPLNQTLAAWKLTVK